MTSNRISEFLRCDSGQRESGPAQLEVEVDVGPLVLKLGLVSQQQQAGQGWAPIDRKIHVKSVHRSGLLTSSYVFAGGQIRRMMQEKDHRCCLRMQ